MLKFLSILTATLIIGFVSNGQLLTTNPDFPLDNSTITITVDATKGNQGLLNYPSPSNVYVHVGVITNLSTGPSDWKYVRFVWGSTNDTARATYIGNNKYEYTIANPRTFFKVPANETILRISFLLRAGGCTDCLAQRNADASDMYIRIYDNSPASKFTLPPFEPKYTPVPEPIIKSVGNTIDLKYVSNQSGQLSLYHNGVQISSVAAGTVIQATSPISVDGNHQIVGKYSSGTTNLSDTINFFVSPPVVISPLPAGVREGINYLPNETSVVLVLYAPAKLKVNVIGDFNNWTQGAGSQLNKTPDGKYFWIQLNGLSPGVEYAYQYLIDDNLRIADHFTEKILDHDNDPFISNATYPSLKVYPTGKTTGIVSVLQTRPANYSWRNNTFNRPDKRNLLVYELLVRDFVSAHDFKTLKDTLSYLKRLGINAIELMPFNEFDGNSSWGYNTSFFFAPDKYYGPANNLKEFIDSCHSNGIAVIMDIVLNHAWGTSSLVKMYYDAANNRPASNSPWFNPVAPHSAISFGNDFNHESDATKYLVDRILEHWLKEYRLDGFRFDFTKGFTQKPSNSDAVMSAYDSSRVRILKRINDSLQSKSPNSYMIIEHLADNSEEKDLAAAGMMPWGNLNYNFNQATMGYLDNNGSNFDWGIHERRGYAQPLLLAYMESHDEERLMFKNIKYGNAAGSYNIKDTITALRRNEMAAAFYFAIPGPKMIWQFGELGYDYSRCYQSTNGEGGDCDKKLDPKPIRWDYQNNIYRKRQFEIYSALIKLRKDYSSPFTSGTITYNLGGAFKTIQVSHADLSLTVIGNFDVAHATSNVTLQNAGTWYNYLTGEPFTASGGSQSFTLAPGEYKFLVNKNVVNAVVTSTNDILNSDKIKMSVYPNPVKKASRVTYKLESSSVSTFTLFDMQGRYIGKKNMGIQAAGDYDLSLRDLFPQAQGQKNGVYLLVLESKGTRTTAKLILGTGGF